MNDKSKKREDNFKKLAPKRLENAVRALRLIGNLSNKSHYLYSNEDADLISKTLKSEVTNTISQFRIAVSREKTNKFKF